MVRICGIIGVTIKKNSNQIIRNLYDIFLFQKERGIDGAGISIANGGELFRFRSLSPFRLFNVYNYNAIWSRIGDGSRVLLHHRYPTSTTNSPIFNHPIGNEDNTIHMIHNGNLFNHKELYNKLKKRHTFETLSKDKKKFTDTEVMLHLFEDRYKGNPENVVKALEYVFEKTSGTFTFAIQIHGDKNIYLIRHGWNYPMVISKDTDGNIYFSSYLDKKNKNLKKIHDMEEGEIGFIDFNGYKRLSLVKTDKIPDVMDYSKLNSYWYGFSGKTNWDEDYTYRKNKRKNEGNKND